MLERMGWKEGKGLGRYEDGQTSHVKVSYKNDMNGMGFKDTDESSVHQDDFNMLLKQLSNSTEVPVKKPQEFKSLEEKSQNSRARVHYKKFTRGKDLSRCSEKDLANIFGKKKLTAEPTIELETKEGFDGDDYTYGVKTVAGGSMTDYFMSKMGLGFTDEKANGQNGSFTSTTKDEPGSDASAEESKKSKKKKNSQTTFVSYVADDGAAANAPSKKKKRKCCGEEIEDISAKKVKVDKNNSSQQDSTLQGLINPAFQPLHNIVTVQKHVLDTITENDEFDITANEETPEKKKRKSKSKLNQTVLDDSQENSRKSDENEDPIEESTASSSKKGKKLKKKMKSFNEDEYDTSKEYLKKKKKGLKCIEDGIENPSFAINDATDNSQTKVAENPYEEKPKKKKKKQKTEESGIENPNFTINDVTGDFQVAVEENPYEEKPKKKKKKQKNDGAGIENPSFASNDASETKIEENPFEEKPKKKKKQKNDESSSFAIDNPTFDVNNDLELVTPSQDYEVKRKGKKKSKGLDNPALNLDNSGSVQSHIVEVQSETRENGIESSTVEISECDIMLNVVEEPVKAPSPPKINGSIKRFNRGNRQQFISQYTSPDDIRRNELFDINTKVIEDGLRDLKRGKTSSYSNTNSFDIASADKMNFHEGRNAKFPRKRITFGRDNRSFDANAQRIEESINHYSRSIDRCQAEVENGINESKIWQQTYEVRVIGSVPNMDAENEVHKDGVTLRYKYANFQSRTPFWAKRNDALAILPKKSYKHLIKGDIVVAFKNTNLHQIDGYGSKNKK